VDTGGTNRGEIVVGARGLAVAIKATIYPLVNHVNRETKPSPTPVPQPRGFIVVLFAGRCGRCCLFVRCKGENGVSFVELDKNVTE